MVATGMRRAWRHVKYTRADLRSAREDAEKSNARLRQRQDDERKWEERVRSSGDRHRILNPYSSLYERNTIADPDLAEPSRPRWKEPHYDMWKGRYILGTGIAIIVSLIFVLTFGIRGLVHNIDHRECPRKAAAMGLQAQFVDYSWFGWECLANIDGRWVPIDTVNNDTGVYIRGGAGQ